VSGDGRRRAFNDFGSSRINLGSTRKRGTALIIVSSLIFMIFAARLIDLQAVKGNELASAALDQRLRTVELPAERGSILDSSGAPLAITVNAKT